MKEQEVVLYRSFETKEVSTLLCGWAIIRCNKDNKPLEVTVSKSNPSDKIIPSIDKAIVTDWKEVQEHGKPRFVAWNVYHPEWILVKSGEEDHPLLGQFPFGELAPSRQWVTTADDEEIAGYISGIFGEVEGHKPEIFPSIWYLIESLEKDVWEPEIIGQKYSAPSCEWFATGLGPGLDSIESFEKDPINGGPFPARIVSDDTVKDGERKQHIIDMSADTYGGDTPSRRLPKEKKNQNLHGSVAILVAAASCQNLLSLVGGSGSMHIPETIFYPTVAANAIAFLSSSLALLLLMKKPNAAGFFAYVGFGFGIATFLLMMTSFLPK